ncbi:MAG: hypothetical protein A2086_11735 [Spirochaetes bacterium GWD1_27_9]|nr:MAG: hypothetical protein A2Z98_02245 [Spirochaetes bacterium GWB1_27_13]OHD24235.1 MAG: hypothetical protein A2Y34_16685 [Spirochaetes bacterium GWC1_27_15]OHD28633.1 MAG: hypothetical protein A2086_11735 [Spirochaetes bacterium GWD1_27_9]
MAIPIIFVHKSNSDYLKYTLSQAKYFNPESPIILIGDDTNDKYKFVKHYNINDYFESANDFASIYKHLSFNEYNYELFCFQRWFIIKDFIIKNNIDDFLYLDSDVLLFCNINKEFVKYKSYDFTICKELSPPYTYFSSKDKLINFCEYIKSLYTDEKMHERLLKKFKKHQDEKLSGGVCDMTAFYEYNKDFSENVFDLNKEIDGSIFDNNFNFSEGFEIDKKFNVKKIYWKRRIPYGKRKVDNKLIKFNGLHCQGGSKNFTYIFYRGDFYFFNYLKVKLRNFYYEAKEKIKIKTVIKNILGR